MNFDNLEFMLATFIGAGALAAVVGIIGIIIELLRMAIA